MTGVLFFSSLILAVSLYTIYQHKHYLLNHRDELLAVIKECRLVQRELERLMEQAVEVSHQVVDQLEQVQASPAVPAEPCRLVLADSGSAGCVGPESPQAVAQKNDSTAGPDIVRPATETLPTMDRIEDTDPEMPLLYRQVQSLYREGYTIKEIARLLKRGQGEINLILNLSRKRRAI